MNIKKLLNVLKSGDLAIIPTDTVYGLIGDATDEDVIKRIYDIKKRDKSKPLLILVSSINMLKKYIRNMSFLEKELVDKYWPGPLTILFEKNNLLSNTLTSNSKYIGIRLPNDEELLNLINKLNKPIIATSANISSKETIKNLKQLEKEFKNMVSYIYDKGEINNPESTIIQVKDNKIIFLRHGELTQKIKKDFKSYL